MRSAVIFSLIVILTFGSYNPVHGQMRKSINLNENWILGEAKPGFDAENSIPVNFQNPGEEWYKAAIPQQVQDSLYAKGLIPDPHVGKNPTKCTWVFEKDWIYATRFATPKNNGDVFLCFNGIDTRADIWLNGKKVGECSNKFHKLRF